MRLTSIRAGSQQVRAQIHHDNNPISAFFQPVRKIEYFMQFNLLQKVKDFHGAGLGDNAGLVRSRDGGQDRRSLMLPECGCAGVRRASRGQVMWDRGGHGLWAGFERVDRGGIAGARRGRALQCRLGVQCCLLEARQRGWRVGLVSPVFWLRGSGGKTGGSWGIR
ncbi:hypothetical protein TMES_01735 [Thalassospira mesophila]|uniref:Uncharacterized protein n=1 Tax=Thalassospira mesophila TaxID=1293891 RepID=A0A1Y2L3X3_9PROT|nr:hypothetical protein TMES_01735 [Thalassospira mesophila]